MSGEYNPLKLCKKEGDHYEVEPGVMYPATLGRIKECLGGAIPTELADPEYQRHPMREPTVNAFLEKAEAFPAGVWDEPDADALDFADSWFKRALVVVAKPPIKLHYVRDPQYRR